MTERKIGEELKCTRAQNDKKSLREESVITVVKVKM